MTLLFWIKLPIQECLHYFNVSWLHFVSFCSIFTQIGLFGILIAGPIAADKTILKRQKFLHTRNKYLSLVILQYSGKE